MSTTLKLTAAAAAVLGTVAFGAPDSKAGNCDTEAGHAEAIIEIIKNLTPEQQREVLSAPNIVDTLRQFDKDLQKEYMRQLNHDRGFGPN